MMICDFGENYKYREYKPYKNEQFNKKIDKMRNLLKSIDETSLRSEDKTLLKQKLRELI